MASEQMWNWFPFPRIEVFTKKKEANRFYKKLTGEKMKMMGRAAECHYLSCDDSVDVAIVYFDEKELKNVSKSQRIGIVAHECSHIVDAVQEFMGEKKMGTETRAYMLESAVLAVSEQLGEEWFSKTRRA